MDANCEAEVQGESVYKLMFEENKWMNRVQTVVCHGRDSITLTYLDNFIRSAVEKILVLVASWPGLNPLLKIFQDIQEFFFIPWEAVCNH
jgi:hypothetical protein